MSIFDEEVPSNVVTAKLLPAKSTDFLRTKPRQPQSVLGIKRDWEVVPGVGYALRIPDLSITFDLTRVRAKFDATCGLLTVRARFAGARTVGDDIISSADFDLSNMKARQDRARYLHERARADEIDWVGLVEELCQRVLEHEQRGEPIVSLQSIPAPAEATSELEAAGLPVLNRLPTIWFGDGGCGKSYLSLYAAIDLAQQGQNVLYCDWEFASEDHAQRLRQIVGHVPAIPNLFYRRCQTPLAHDVSFLSQAIHQHKISFLICDSVGFACGGKPEDSDSALKYFSAVRALGSIGSLHIAHINKSEQGDQKPFGSVFWSNGARSIWYVKRSEAESGGTGDFTTALYHRKANTGRLQQARAMRFQFVGTEVRIFPTDISNHEDLSDKTSLSERIIGRLKHGSMTAPDLAAELEAKEGSVRRFLNRSKNVVELPSATGLIRYGLVANDV